MKILIAAGGKGTKLWPLSTKENPKQFQKIIGDKTLFARNVEMLLKKYKPEDIYVSTKQMYKKVIKEQPPEIPEENLIIEPDAFRGRGPAEGFAFLKMFLVHPDEVFTLLQADCLYIPEETYLETIEMMEKVVLRDKKLISGGLQPKHPMIGVDYLALDEVVEEGGGAKIYSVKKFLGRKQTLDETQAMIEKEKAVIHVNINTWTPKLMLDAYKEIRPDWCRKLTEIKNILGTEDEEKKIKEIFNTMEVGSTEEVTKHVFEKGYIVEFPFKWVDIGSWDSVYQHQAKNNEVYIEGNVVSLDSSGTLVKSTSKDKLIAILGLEDMVVVDSDEVLFIAPRDKVGQTKDIHDELKKKGLEKFL